MRMRILQVAILLGGLSQFSFGDPIFVVGSVNITSGTALDTITGTSIIFAPPCDTTASAASIALLGGCAQAEVSAYSGGTPGTPSGPLESTGPNGSPPVGSGLFIAGINTGTTYPLTPFMEFVNSSTTAIGIVVQANSVGPGTQTNCTASSAPNAAPCSLYLGDPVTLSELGNGVTELSLDVTGLAWDPVAPTNRSNFKGAFTTQITFLNGIVDPTPAQIQAFFGCPTTSATTTIGQCTALGNSFQTSNSAGFTAAFTSPVPEPGTTSPTILGTGLISLAALLRRRTAKVK